MLSNDINDGSAPFRKHASQLDMAQAHLRKRCAATIKVIRNTCARQVKMSTVRTEFG